MASDIERWGSGLKRIYEACQEAKVKVTFENLKTGFLVTFYRPEIGVREIKKIGGLGEGVNSLLVYIRKNPGQRIIHISKALKVPQKTLERWIKKLKEERKIKYKGSFKTGGYWEFRK
jgi:ATP-dependent DNA helicase RecG